MHKNVITHIIIFKLSLFFFFYEQRTEYEEKLRNEINKIRSQTDVEIERLKSTCHQTFERENR